jgi:transcription elongation factor GreA
MVKNSEAIGHAAGFGDLSENAEFTAALEQRDFLSRRANDIAAEIGKARVIPIEEITSEFANVGTSVTVREAGGGGQRTLTFLGPWDADLERGVYSYLAPFAKSFLGRRVGETVEARGEEGAKTYEILAIAIAEIPE